MGEKEDGMESNMVVLKGHVKKVQIMDINKSILVCKCKILLNK